MNERNVFESITCLAYRFTKRKLLSTRDFFAISMNIEEIPSYNFD